MSERRLLLVSNFLSATGTHRMYCEDMAERLEARAWCVVRTSSQPSRVRRLADMAYTTWTRRGDYELAHVDVFSGPSFVWAEAVCFELQRIRKPYVLTLRGGNLPEFSRRWPRRTRRLLAAATRVTAPSAYLQREMASYADEIVVIPNALDLARYQYATRAAVQPRLVWLRTFHTLYNPVLAVEVVARLASRFPAVRMKMIGADRRDGALEAVRRRAALLGVADRLEIIEGVPKQEVPRHLTEGDIFLNTPDIDNTPTSVLEAMACGLCVVSTNVGGIPDMLAHEHDALLVPPRQPDEMAAAVARLLEEPGLAARLSAAGRALAVARDWNRVLGHWEDLFTEVVARA